MSLWIRSQDKEMVMNCNAVGIGLDGNKSIYSGGYLLGTYSTKEKALAVLDDITSWINGLEYVRNVNTYRSTFVYQMPQDDEVSENE